VAWFGAAEERRGEGRTGEENSKVPSAPWRAFKKEIGGFGGSKRERVHGTDRDGSWVS